MPHCTAAPPGPSQSIARYPRGHFSPPVSEMRSPDTHRRNCFSTGAVLLYCCAGRVPGGGSYRILSILAAENNPQGRGNNSQTEQPAQGGFYVQEHLLDS